jgi:predicted DNA-binding protein (UPF0251 family)
MPRPVKCRFVRNFPGTTVFKPCGMNDEILENNFLSFDELEALRLADYKCMKQEQAAEIMGVSRATFGRIVEKARSIVTDSLLNGKVLIIQGGDYCHKRIGSIDQVNEVYEPTHDSTEYTDKINKKCANCTRYVTK